MKILISGINGFVGTQLRRALEEQGHEVSGLDTRSPDSDVAAVDITDGREVSRHIQESGPEFIFHLAAISRVDNANPSLLYAVNAIGTANIFNAAANLDRKPQVLFVSSSQVYGIVADGQQPISESVPVNPVNHYGASKAAGEDIAAAFRRENGLPVAVVRPFNHIGRGQDSHFVIPKFIKAMKEKQPHIEMGNLSGIRDFLDVRDVIEAYLGLMNSFQDGGVYNVSSGTGYRLSDLMDLIQEIGGFRLDIKQSRSLVRQNDILKAIGDSSALTRLTGWRPRRSMRETIEWMLSEQ